MDDTLEQLRSLAVSTVSDALDRLAIAGHCLGIKPLAPAFRLCGRAFTIRMVPVGASGGSVGDYIDDVPPGAVVVLDNGGRPDATVWGDILTFVAHRRQIGGTVIDGHCRDIAQSLETGYPIFSRGWSMRTGKDRVRLEATNVPVEIGQAAVNPGDLLLGNGDGVVVVPREKEREIVALAQQIDAAEDRIRAAIEAGSRLDAARQQFKYHDLQRRSPPPK